MTYTINQKIGKNIYLYEVVSYWDKEKKQARQKRIYLGKKDALTGKAVTPRKDKRPQAVRDYGHVYTIKKIAEQLGLGTLLQKSFPDCWEKILGLAYYRLLENRPFYLQKLWSENTCVEKSLSVDSREISKLLQLLGNDSAGRFDFLEKWAAKRGETECFFFDITSLSSYSNCIDFVERGYNRDGDKLPQVNLGILQSHPDGLPLMYQLYPGSIADVSTLKNVIKQAAGLNLKINTMVMDKGFYSLGNLQELEENKIKFIAPLPMTTKIAKALLSKYQAKLTSPINAFHRKESTMFYSQDKIEIAGSTFTAHLYLDEQKRLEEINALFKRLDDLEMQVANNCFSDKDDVIAFMNRTMRGSPKFYTVRMKEGVPLLARKRNALTFRMNHAGKFILITNNHALTRDDVLSIYRQRDSVEKLFDVMKNEIDDARLRVHSREAAEGSLFILFIAAILYAELSRRMRLANLFKKYTISEVFGEMKKLRVVNMSHGAPHITEISKRQRDVWDALKIPYPVAPSY